MTLLEATIWISVAAFLAFALGFMTAAILALAKIDEANMTRMAFANDNMELRNALIYAAKQNPMAKSLDEWRMEIDK